MIIIVSNVANKHMTEGKMLMKGAAITTSHSSPSRLINRWMESKERIKLTWTLNLLPSKQEGGKEVSNKLKHNKATVTESKPWEEIYNDENLQWTKYVWTRWSPTGLPKTSQLTVMCLSF